MITIVAVGKKHDAWVQPGIERYQTRIKQPFNVEWVLLPHSSLEGQAARQEESERILSRLTPSDHVILLDETGSQQTSPAFAQQFNRLFTTSKSVILVIGGAYGVDEVLLTRANQVLSLSDMVLPHQLVRLVLLEQIYRAQEITRGSQYHHA